MAVAITKEKLKTSEKTKKKLVSLVAIKNSKHLKEGQKLKVGEELAKGLIKKQLVKKV